MKSLKFSLTLFIFLFLSYLSVFAFTTFPKATLKVDKKEISVGDMVNAEIDIFVPSFALLLQSENDFFIEGWDIYDFYFVEDILDKEKYKLKLILTTYDSKLKEIPKIKLSYINKVDSEKDISACEKFYFFTNSVPIVIDSILDKYDNDSIFDIKKTRKMTIPVMFYMVCIVFVLFVIFVLYKNIIFVKMQKYVKVNFSPVEKAIRQLNNIHVINIDISKIDSYYCKLSIILKSFILELLDKKNIEFTSAEMINMISLKNNIFYDYHSEISALFKIYDDAKYSVNSLNRDKFIDVYTQTKNIIEKLNSQKINLEIK